MTQEQFEASLRKYMHARPFFTFLVEKNDGQTIIVERPSIAFNAGAATYIDPDDNLLEFFCEDVRDMRLAQPEAAS